MSGPEGLGTGTFAHKQLAKAQASEDKMVAVAIDALEDRAAAAERLNRFFVGALVVILALALGRELSITKDGVTTGSTAPPKASE